ncbi:unnamed protein product, partial [Ectocarpus fasciculatus]
LLLLELGKNLSQIVIIWAIRPDRKAAPRSPAPQPPESGSLCPRQGADDQQQQCNNGRGRQPRRGSSVYCCCPLLLSSTMEAAVGPACWLPGDGRLQHSCQPAFHAWYKMHTTAGHCSCC